MRKSVLAVMLQENLRSGGVAELERMSSKLHSLLKSERQLLDRTIHLDVSGWNGEELIRHQAKVSALSL